MLAIAPTPCQDAVRFLSVFACRRSEPQPERCCRWNLRCHQPLLTEARRGRILWAEGWENQVGVRRGEIRWDFSHILE